MTPPNATPTRADVLREFSTPRVSHTSSGFHWDGKTWDEPTRESLADEIVRLRAERAAMIRRVEALRMKHIECEDPWYSCPESADGCANDALHGCNCGADRHNAEVDSLLAALRDGGTDGQ